MTETVNLVHGCVSRPRRTTGQSRLRRGISRRGVTLVEVLVVLVLVGLLASAIVFGAGNVSATRLRAAATLTVVLCRSAITRANSSGYPVRIVFDLDANTISLEESSSSRVLRDRDAMAPPAASVLRAEAERSGEQAAERFLEGVSPGRPQFLPVKDLEIGGEPAGTPHPMGNGIRYRQVQTEHDDKPRQSGRAYLYFWPGGGTEWASVQLQRSADEGLTVLISPLTGRARVQRGQVDLPERQDDGSISEMEDPS